MPLGLSAPADGSVSVAYRTDCIKQGTIPALPTSREFRVAAVSDGDAMLEEWLTACEPG